MANRSTALSALEKAVRSTAEQEGLEFVEIELVKEPTGRYLRVFVDKEGGVSLDELEVFHKQIRSFADEIDYDYMEVSSPGADRPLKKPEDFEKNKGAMVEVKLFKPVNGSKQYVGELVGLADEILSVKIGEEIMKFEKQTVALVRPYIDVDGLLAE